MPDNSKSQIKEGDSKEHVEDLREGLWPLCIRSGSHDTRRRSGTRRVRTDPGADRRCDDRSAPGNWCERVQDPRQGQHEPVLGCWLAVSDVIEGREIMLRIQAELHQLSARIQDRFEREEGQAHGEYELILA